MVDSVSISCPDLPDPGYYSGMSPGMADYLRDNNEVILQLIRDLKRDLEGQQRFGTSYIDLPIWSMFHTGAAYGTKPTRLPVATPTESGYPSIYYNVNYDPTGGFIATRFTNLAETSVWHTMFRLPANYSAGTNLTVTFNAFNIRYAVAAAPTTHKVDMSAYRDTNTEGGAGQGMFGYNATPIPGPGTFVWNKDICTTSEQTLSLETELGMYTMAETKSFVINGSDAAYPLAPNRKILLTWTSTTQSSDANSVRNKFANFYVAYSGGG